MSWVTAMTAHEMRNAQPDQRTARSDPATESATRDARTWSSTARTVLVPNSQASSTSGASVRSTSHSGTTTLSSTWLEDSTPLQAARTTNPVLRQAAGEAVIPSATVSTGTDRVRAGSVVAIITALRTSSPPVSSGTSRTASVPSPSATPLAPAPRV